MQVLVLIADIVESRSIPDRAVFQRNLRNLLGAINKHSGQNLLSPYTITVGDEFQAVYRDTNGVFSDVMQIVSRLFPNRIRFSLSYGALSTELNREAALGMDGPAFSRARNLLSELKRQGRTVIQIDLPESDPIELVNVCLTLFANDLERWNENAVSTFSLLLRGFTPRQISRETGVHFTTIYRHIRAKHLDDYRKMFDLLSHELLKEIHVRAAR